MCSSVRVETLIKCSQLTSECSGHRCVGVQESWGDRIVGTVWL